MSATAKKPSKETKSAKETKPVKEIKLRKETKAAAETRVAAEKVAQYAVATLDDKYKTALDKIGGRLKLTAIMTRRLKELRQAGLKQKGSFNDITESIFDEINDGSLTIEEPTKKSKK